MTVQQLINRLMLIEDKTQEITLIDDDDYQHTLEVVIEDDDSGISLA